MRNEAETALEAACTDPGMTGHWMMYLGTVTYPCNDTPTACYPRGFNTAATPRDVSLGLVVVVALLDRFIQKM